MNFSLWLSWIPAQFLNGRLFAANRVREMSPARRLAYVAGSPLIPLVRLVRIASAVRSRPLVLRFVRSLPALIIGLAVDGAAQFTGYLLGQVTP